MSDTHQALSIIERFERQARSTPDAMAVSCGVARLTYRELDAKANRLARHLRACGVEREALVGLLHERSVDLVVGVLGILKAGGAYVPVDPANPGERVAAVLADAGVRAVVTQSDLARMVPGHVEHLVRLDADAAALEGLSPEALGVQIGGADAAYVIYTSGSTGKPKGVIVTHYNVVRLFDATSQWYSFGPTDAWTLFHSIAFDFSVWELWGALLYGGRLVVVPQETTRAPEQFLDLLVSERVTVLNQTPSAFRMLTQADAARAEPAAIALRYVVFGGEALDLGSLRPWVARHGDDAPQLINMYGITETTVHVTYRRIRRQDIDQGLGSVIGEPIPDLQFYLLGEDRQPVPPGVPGEIYVGGAGVARGYLNRPELNAERFVADPFTGTAGARMYRSGDQARRLPDGDVEYMGRLDTQVKIRGHRIELREIEVALRDCAGVGDAVVAMREETPGDNRLVAYYTHRNGDAEPTSATLRQALEQHLPEYMVPSYFVPLEAIPLTANGKADRRALPAPGRQRPELAHPMVAPRTPVERWVAAHWQELLNVDGIGVQDRFFELGGTSITAMRLLARLSQETGTRLPAVLLFRAPTIADMARLLEDDHYDVLPADVRGTAHSRVMAASRAALPSAAERAAQRRDALRERRLQRRPGG